MVKSSTEIRKLPIGELHSLARCISPDAWKLFMASPKSQTSLSMSRFTSQEVRMFEDDGKLQRRLPAEIFLSQWCMMGETLPTVGSLIQLLREANLHEAANYIAFDILKAYPDFDMSYLHSNMKRVNSWGRSNIMINISTISSKGRRLQRKINRLFSRSFS